MLSEHQELLRSMAHDKLNIELSPSQIEQFSTYADLLLEWNEKVNLTSIVDPQEVVIKHFVDSLTLGEFVQGSSLADIGTGAGFPGIPLKILYPELELYLVDSLAKRLDFLKMVISTLQFKSAQTVHSRAEDFARDPKYRENFDCVTSRAVARLPVLLEYAVPLLKVNGHFLAAKGSQVDDEVKESEQALKVLGAKITGIKRFTLGAEAEHRAVVIVEKTTITPKEYPRKAGTPAKKPLI